MKKSLEEFGRYIGICFQIVDDTLDYFSEEKMFGKEVGNDFNEGKDDAPFDSFIQKK